MLRGLLPDFPLPLLIHADLLLLDDKAEEAERLYRDFFIPRARSRRGPPELESGATHQQGDRPPPRLTPTIPGGKIRFVLRRWAFDKRRYRGHRSEGRAISRG